tara:strand:- start:168 stop:488 length:321 start_codon:yes stop_codon:yes gene_type:complete
MIIGIITILLNFIALGLIYWLRKDQEMTNGLIESDLQGHEHGMNAMMENFNNYQVETDRKIAHLEKQLEIKTKESERKIIRLTSELPKVIRNVVGHIEFARPLDKK